MGKPKPQFADEKKETRRFFIIAPVLPLEAKHPAGALLFLEEVK